MFSILIPTYNDDVSNLTRSLIKQGNALQLSFEIICWDDCSSDSVASQNNKALCAEFDNYSYYRSATNLGDTQTRTSLALKAKYDWLLFVDSDVLPGSETFLKKYVAFIGSQNPIIFGGCQYSDHHENQATMLRWTFGHSRESQTAESRNQKPYHYIFSSNFLTDKNTFLSIKFPKKNIYGMDSFFSYQLYQKAIPVLHIDNPILHLGLDKNEIFFQKSLEAVKLRKNMFSELPGIENINSLLKNYNRLRRLHLDSVVGLFFNLSEPVLRKMILGKNRNLFCLDLYRLGYICVIK
ncbi:glycosyltransferase family 2 protein [Flavobacterium supellecticarium]|uniref:Glycosyltransferase family 2 protein n=1 Tax=Flavobacterium supellecticarium TaxID=2565924 RepID=A0A4S3ZZW0_9FLAO|nr:glycosyltransferase [Flavobacterium supellecticarium]THF51457.1 glycosyltransferase family 2 protein [Flavobacterium supellecticarium]